MKTIILSYSLSEQCWVAETLVDGKPCPECLDQFGTHVLPTAFSWTTDGWKVRSEIKRMNPQAEVRLSAPWHGILQEAPAVQVLTR